MGDYHIRGRSKDSRKVTVVFHIPVPVGANSTGTSFETAVSEHKGVQTSLLSGISAGEQTKLKNGELWEVQGVVLLQALDTESDMFRKIDERFIALKESVQDEIWTTLEYWGYEKVGPTVLARMANAFKRWRA